MTSLGPNREEALVCGEWNVSICQCEVRKEGQTGAGLCTGGDCVLDCPASQRLLDDSIACTQSSLPLPS